MTPGITSAPGTATMPPAPAEVSPAVRSALTDWEEAKRIRAPYEDDWHEIARWCAPRKLSETHTAKGDPLSHSLSDTTSVDAGERFAALIYGFLFGGREPFAVPQLLSRDKTTHEENLWFDAVSTKLHKFFKSADVTFRAAMQETLYDQTLFGTGNIWSGSGLGQTPRFRATPIFDFWWIPGEEGKPEQAFRKFRMPAGQAARRYGSARIREIATKTPSFELEFLQVSRRRSGGRRGASVRNKPVADLTILIDGSELVAESGYEAMPFAVGRFQTRPGERYGYGIGHKMAPTAKWLNRLYEAVVSGAEKAIDPPLFDMTNGAFKDFDRRAGAVNMGTFDALGFGNVREALQTLGPEGDLRPGREILQMAKGDILRAAYLDWLENMDGPRKTATQVLDERDLRFKSLSGFFADTENNLAGPVIDSTFQSLLAAGYFPPLPDSLRGELLDFEFRSPLAAAMSQGDVESILRTLDLAGGISQIDPSVIDYLDTDAMLRQGAADYGLKHRLLRSDEDVDDIRRKREEAARQAEEAAAAQAAATSLRDGAQGVASLQNAGAAQ